MAPKIPFNRPALCGREMQYTAQALLNAHTAADGPFSRKCQELLEATLGVPSVLLTASCTDALELSALLLDIGPEDEVIVPSFTFVSTANAFALRGARIVFADIREDTLNLDERQLESKITPRTKAIVPVHYAGVGCRMDTILSIASAHGIAVVEDNAHGLYARFQGKQLGTFGALATQSFHETKNIICGEGGALVVNDPALVDRAEILRDKGTNRKRFLRGQVDKYTWVDIGSSFGLSDLLAAFLLGQLEQRDEIYRRRKDIWHRYHTRLAGWAESQGVRQPHVPEDCDPSYHMYYLLLPSLACRNAFVEHLAERGVNAVFHYTPLHASRMGAGFGSVDQDCPVTGWVSDRLIRLPLFHSLSEEEQDRVIQAVESFSA